MYASRHYNSNGEEKRHGTKYLESRKEKTSPIHAQNEEEEEERKTPRRPKKKLKKSKQRQRRLTDCCATGAMHAELLLMAATFKKTP
jgi:hypothetical protein